MVKSLYDNFKHWSNNGSIYLISDTHFDDVDCIYMDSNWPSCQDHINIINKYVTKNDTLIHLGDVGNVEWIKKLNYYKVLIMGNHDVGKSKYLRKQEHIICKTLAEAKHKKTIGEIDSFTKISDSWIGIKDNKLFDEVYEGPLIISKKIILSHEPIHNLTCFMNIHGHEHNNPGNDFYHLNIASNMCDYTPINLGTLINNGLLKHITNIHRQTINKAIERKENNEG